jgi:hypothetical protein
MMEYINATIYSDEDTDKIEIHKHTGTWKIGMTKNEPRSILEFHYYNGLKPHWLHLLMARLLLGWKWEDRK